MFFRILPQCILQDSKEYKTVINQLLTYTNHTDTCIKQMERDEKGS